MDKLHKLKIDGDINVYGDIKKYGDIKIYCDIKESLERKDSGKNIYTQKASMNPKKVKSYLS